MTLPGNHRVWAIGLLLIAIGCARTDVPKKDVKGGDGVLRLSLPGEPRSLNPNVAPLDEYALIVCQNIFSRLVSQADDGTIVPELAERWSQSADGLSYTFHLRGDVRFHDGTPLTVEDVRATFARINESANSELAQHIAGVDVGSDRSVVVHLKAPWAAFIPTLGWYGASILPAHIYGGSPWAGNPANMRPIGSGPFRFKSWEPGRRIVLEKNPEFFGQGPYLDQLDYVIVATPSEAVQLLLAGNVDLVIGRPPATMMRALKHSPGLRVSLSPSDGRTYLAFNMRRPPFNDLRLRRAVNLALDRRAIVDTALPDLGTPAVGFYTPAVAWAYNGNARVPPHDPAAARKLVAEAGPLPRIVFAFPGMPAAAPTPVGAEIIRQLEAVGFRIDPKPFAPQEYLARMMADRSFDLLVLSGSHGPDPDAMAARFGSAGSMQIMGYSNPDLDAVLGRGGMISDPAARAAAYYRAQDILAADLPIAPLFETVRASVFRDGIRGLPHEDASGLVPDYTFNLVRLRTAGADQSRKPES